MEIADKDLITSDVWFLPCQSNLIFIAEYSSSRGREKESKVPVRSQKKEWGPAEWRDG